MVDSGRPHLLYVTHRVPYPVDKGDRIRCFNILRYLSRRADVSLACLADEPPHPDAEVVLRKYAYRLSIVPLTRTRWLRALFSVLRGATVSEGAFSSPFLRQQLTAWARERSFTAALASASSVAPYLMQGWLHSAPAVIDLMDVDSQKWLDYVPKSRPPKRWIYHLEGTRMRRLERRLADWARGLLLVANAERELFLRTCPVGNVLAVTNGVDLDYFSPQSTEAEIPQRCVFVGAMDYMPNVDGANWFCQEVWPGVRQRFPSAQIAFVGRSPTAEVLALKRFPGVEVTGSVPDVRPFVSQAAVVVVPLRIARGIQNKVLEGLAMAKATLISPQPLEGLAVADGEHLLVARSPTEWVERLAQLFTDNLLRTRLGQSARAFVERHHSWERCLAPLGQLLNLSQTPLR